MRKLFALSLLSLLPIVSSAATVEYTNRAAWEAAVGSVNTIGFEGLAGPSGLARASSFSINGVTFLAEPDPVAPEHDSTLIAFSAAQNDWVAAWDSGDALMAGLGGLLISLPEGMKAFGVDVIITFLAFYPRARPNLRF